MFVRHEGIGNQDLLPFRGLRNDDHKEGSSNNKHPKIRHNHVKNKVWLHSMQCLYLDIVRYRFILASESGSASTVKKRQDHKNKRFKGSKP